MSFTSADGGGVLLRLEDESAVWVNAMGHTAVAQSVSTEHRSVWIPTADGGLRPRDLAETTRLADHLGRWVELLDDDDPRLLAAEATRDQLHGELRLPEPRRAMLRACVQSALDLLRSDIERFTEEWAELLEVDLEGQAAIVPDPGADTMPIAEADHEGEEAYRAASDAVTGLADAAAEVLPEADADASAEPATGPSDDEAYKPGRGTVLVKFGKWASTEAGSALIQAGAVSGGVIAAPWIAKAPGELVRLIESLLNLVGL